MKSLIFYSSYCISYLKVTLKFRFFRISNPPPPILAESQTSPLIEVVPYCIYFNMVMVSWIGWYHPSFAFMINSRQSSTSLSGLLDEYSNIVFMYRGVPLAPTPLTGWAANIACGRLTSCMGGRHRTWATKITSGLSTLLAGGWHRAWLVKIMCSSLCYSYWKFFNVFLTFQKEFFFQKVLKQWSSIQKLEKNPITF